VNPSSALATVLVDELVANGVTDAVLAPGSRSAPLAMALYAADAAGRIRLHVRIDERTAGFLAVGLAGVSGRPVPIVTTSGTAVANLHPAIVEADLAGVPVLVLSADRPPWIRDVGANQTIDQARIFGGSVRFFHEFETPTATSGLAPRWRSMLCRALGYATGAAGRPGPVQLNVPLADPLLPDDDSGWPDPLVGSGEPWTTISSGTTADDWSAAAPDRADTAAIPGPQPGERVLFVADLTHPAADTLAERGHLVLSEAAGAAGPRVLESGFHLVADELFLAANTPDRIIVLGRPTLHRPLTRLLTDPKVQVDVVAPAAGWRGLAGNVSRVAPRLANIGKAGAGPWATAWRQANAAAASAIEAQLENQPLSCSPALARTLVNAIEPGSRLVLGSSQPVRDVALAAAARDRLPITANRGAAGIDGTVSTAIGAALAHSARHTGRTYGYLGDLTLLHDVTGLVIGPDEPRPDLILVISNNDGGGIFATLESGDTAHSAAFERVFGTPHRADLEPLVTSLGHRHTLVETRDQLKQALEPEPGVQIIEVRTDRDALRAQLSALQKSVRAALHQLA
jgi:2-succinyl-5-enolpyruvyl-6-hydroxy-3-cyclohexene-1-carboxylate synthase